MIEVPSADFFWAMRRFQFCDKEVPWGLRQHLGGWNEFIDGTPLYTKSRKVHLVTELGAQRIAQLLSPYGGPLLCAYAASRMPR